MSEQVRALLTQILALPAKERLELMDAVDMSLGSPPDVEAAWTAEIGRRLERLRAGTEEVLDWSEARALIHRSRK
jgi:putative addiction module component (TIGR02574 family)